ncbi:MAG: hypothetical protein ABI162_18805 [Luteolibacter sp.]
MAYYETKAKILALATGFFEGDDETRALLCSKADFFPLSKEPDCIGKSRSLVVRVNGQMFLVEDTPGGEKGVFSLLMPYM